MPVQDSLLIQVVPRLLPGRCGVSDQAVLLAEELRSGFGIDTAFAVVNSDQRCEVPYPVVHCPALNLLDTCLKLTAGRPGAVLVHLSGYGYSVDGAPADLAQALAGMRACGKFQIGVYFHELFASGMPWQSAFWHARRQQRVLRSVAALADLLVTNIGLSASWLERDLARHGRTAPALARLPVFSAIGETAQPRSIAEREPGLAVFGLPGSRKRAYRGLPSLGRTLRLLGIREIVDVGQECDAPSRVLGIPVRRMGELPAAEVAAVFSKLSFALVSYPPPCLAKSSVFASVCAQGTVPVLPKGFSGEWDGLRDGKQLVSPRTVDAVLASGLGECSRSAWRWYHQHRRAVHARLYAQWLNGRTAEHGTGTDAAALAAGVPGA